MRSKLPYILVFLLCFLYWAYLIPRTEMVIAHDSIGYEQNGALIYHKGFLEFFKSGESLSREPLYHLVIALSMKIADLFSVSYHLVLKIIQVLLLFITQVLLLVLLNMLKIDKRWQLVTIFYFGLSPAIVNMAFSVYYEVIVYPLVPAFVLVAFFSWKAIHDADKKRIILMALLTGGLFVLGAFGRGVFRYVFFIVLIPFAWTAIESYVKGRRQYFLNAVLYLMAALLAFYPLIAAYVYMNKKYAGQFQYNSRHSALFLTSAHKRANELTPRIVLAHLSNIPGDGVCRKFFSEKECLYCSWEGSYASKAKVFYSLMDIPKEKRAAKTFQWAFEKIKEHPFQYLFFMGYEALRMLFWESTKIGYVQYPQLLQRLFDMAWFRYGIRLAISLLTIFSVIYLLLAVYQKRALLGDYTQKGEATQICFFILLVALPYIGIYSLCFVLTRYPLPIASLYLLAIAYFFQNMKWDFGRVKKGLPDGR